MAQLSTLGIVRTTHMNTTIRYLVIVSASLLFCGCESYRDTVRGIGSSLGAIQIRDIKQADVYRQTLPGYLKLAPEQVHVEAGSGVSDVTITGVSSDDERQKITATVADLNAQNQISDKIRLRFE